MSRNRKESNEVSPQNEHAKKIIKEDSDRKAKKVIKDEYYAINGNKLLKVTIIEDPEDSKKNGNKSRVYVGNTKKKEVKEFVNQLKAKGERIEQEF